MNAARRRLFIGLLMCLAFAVLSTALVMRQRLDAAAAIRQSGATLQRMISQRVDQHDAHLTSLSALVLTADPAPRDALHQVAQTIMRFYPRIGAIDVVDPADPARPALLGTPVPASVVTVLPELSNELFRLVPDAQGERLHLLKRVPAEGPLRGALMMSVNLRRLAASDEPSDAFIRLTLALDNAPILDVGPKTATQVMFDQTISSRTQPLQLTLGSAASPALPWTLLTSLALVLVGLAWALDRLLEARRVAREAGLRALVAAHDAKLAHAGRVNAMGELASGIAHELTQPLTAILSNAQAGQRLVARPELDREAITTAFDAATRNAKRAGDILGRLRTWLTKGEPVIEPVDVGSVVADVVQLVATDAAAAGIVIEASAAQGSARVMADRVQLEQVVFNLVRNAMEALAGQDGERRIRIDCAPVPDGLAVTVRDNGPGFANQDLPRVFEPFFTTRPARMGLGLSLCTTLVERYGGQLTAENTAQGALMTVTLPRLRRNGEQDAAAPAMAAE